MMVPGQPVLMETNLGLVLMVALPHVVVSTFTCVAISYCQAQFQSAIAIAIELS